MTVSNNVGLDNSWTAELVRSIDKRGTEGGFGNYIMAVGENALVIVASLVDTVKHAVFMAPYSLLTGNIGTSFWHGTRAVTHVLQAPLALPGLLVPKITVATANMLQITAKWEEQVVTANWKEKAITFAKEGLEKVRNIPHAFLAAKIAGGAAVAGAAGTAAHKLGYLEPVYNLLGYGEVPPPPVNPGFITWLLSFDPTGILPNYAAPVAQSGAEIVAEGAGFNVGSGLALTAAAAGLWVAKGRLNWNLGLIADCKKTTRRLRDQNQDYDAQNNPYVYNTRTKTFPEAIKATFSRIAIPAVAVAATLGARHMGYISDLTTVGVAGLAAARVAHVA
ncbi:MAG: hypothetical protein Q8K75_10450 [Chlamydiales bacterium]|nr:hypothetical protein [Chlamydiales bacterium]